MKTSTIVILILIFIGVFIFLMSIIGDDDGTKDDYDDYKPKKERDYDNYY
jgi:hypothetical protein